jgi:hypothetical protein
MTPGSTQSVTDLLQAWASGDQTALEDLLPLVYDDLRRQARRFMRLQPARHTLQTTALVHEAYLRLVGQSAVKWNGRAHFFAVAAKAMRSILVDHARARSAAKRGGSARAITLDDAAGVAGPQASVDVLGSTTRSAGWPSWMRGRASSWSCAISGDSGSMKRRPCWASHRRRSSASGPARGPGSGVS